MARCSNCGKQIGFLSQITCTNCGKKFCSDCMVKVSMPSDDIESLLELINEIRPPKWSWKKFGRSYCPDCEKKYNQVVSKLVRAMAAKERVELVSANYKGYKKFDKGSARPIKTNFHRDIADAEDELKALALYYGKNMVVNVRKKKDRIETESDSGKGTYIYNVWGFEGDAVSGSR